MRTDTIERMIWKPGELEIGIEEKKSLEDQKQIGTVVDTILMRGLVEAGAEAGLEEVVGVISEGEKFNRFHDARGRFASSGGGGISIQGGTGEQRVVVREELDKVPESDVQLVDEIRFAGTQPYMEYTNGSIILPTNALPSELRSAISHEVGHAVWDRRLSPEQQDEWARSAKKIHANMAGTNKMTDPRLGYLRQMSVISGVTVKDFGQELFAECYSWHNEGGRGRQFLESTFPRRAAKMAEVMK